MNEPENTNDPSPSEVRALNAYWDRERRRTEVGLDKCWLGRAGFSPGQVHALERDLVDATNLSDEETRNLKEATVRLLALSKLHESSIVELESEIQAVRSRVGDQRAHLAIFVGVVLGIVALLNFSSVEITVDPDDNAVFAVEQSWWGLSERWRRLRWMKAGGYRFPAWMAQDLGGEWYPYVRPDFGPDLDLQD